MPAQPSNPDDFSLGELARILATLSIAVDGLRDDIKKLSLIYDTKERVDLITGGIKVDIRRIDEERIADAKELRVTAEKLDVRLDEQEREVNRRFRQAVSLTIAAVIGPSFVAFVAFLLTHTAHR